MVVKAVHVIWDNTVELRARLAPSGWSKNARGASRLSSCGQLRKAIRVCFHLRSTQHFLLLCNSQDRDFIIWLFCIFMELRKYRQNKNKQRAGGLKYAVCFKGDDQDTSHCLFHLNPLTFMSTCTLSQCVRLKEAAITNRYALQTHMPPNSTTLKFA